VFRTAPGMRVRDILRAWKGYTAGRANRLLCRQGTFWQREYYDRLIRDARELERANEYVRANPEKAGLIGWKWVQVFDRPFVVKYEER
jgi:putative transposase